MNLSLISPINFLSYGIVGSYLNTELQKLGINVSLFPINQQGHEAHPKHYPYLKQGLKNTDTYDRDADCLLIWHQFDLTKFVGKGQHIGFPIFELNKFTERELHHLKNCDRLFVCSKWAKSIIEENNIDVQVDIIPLGVDTEIFTPQISTRSNTIFLNVGKFEKRKGHDILPIIFNEAFSGGDNAELWMMCSNPFYTSEENLEWEVKYRDLLGDKVKFIPHQQSQEDVARIMQQADCGAFPSRGEGFNLPALEMLACGKHLIITDYSAHTEFCTNENAHLIPIDKNEIAFDNKWFCNNCGEWAYLGQNQIDSFVEKLQQVHQLKQNRQLCLNESGIKTSQSFSWENAAKCIIKALFNK